MSNERKRELVREYRERPRHRGVYAVRCAPTGQVWASASQNLDTQENALWFQLRTGGHPNRELQTAWNQHSAAAFTYEVVAALADEPEGVYALRADLKELEEEWREKLAAKKVTG